MTAPWSPPWLRNPMTATAMDAGVRHFDRASDLAVLLDKVAGSDEIEAGAIYADLIRSQPPGARPVVIELCLDADVLRRAFRTMH